jgi:hypothetical protein
MSSNYSPAFPEAKVISTFTSVTYTGTGTGTMTAAAVYDLSSYGVGEILGVSVNTTDLTWSARSGLIYNPVAIYVNGSLLSSTFLSDQTAGASLFFSITGFNYDAGTKQLTVDVSFSGDSSTTVNTNSGNPSINLIAFGQ